MKEIEKNEEEKVRKEMKKTSVDIMEKRDENQKEETSRQKKQKRNENRTIYIQS